MIRRLPAVSLFVATALTAMLTRTARAQSTTTVGGFQLDRFEPSDRGSDWFTQESLEFRDTHPAIGVVGDYAHNPLVIYGSDGSLRSAIVSDQLFFHVGGSVVLAKRLRLGLNLPIAAYQNGAGGISNGRTFQVPSAQAVGDLRLTADVRLFGKYGDPFTLAAGVQLFAPTGDRDNFTSDGTFRAQPRLLGAGHVGLFTYAAKIGFEYRPNDASFAGSDLGSVLLVGAAAGIQADHGRLIVGPEFWGSTVVTSNEGPFKTRNTPLEALLGGHYQVGDWKLGAGAGPGLTRGYGEPDFRVVADVEWAPPVAEDRDGDGIADAEDACPDVAGIRTADPRTNGCPDRDRDGIADSEDACPDVPGARDADPKKNGCPPDRDNDGIADGEDACPDVPGVRDADPKKNGCPPDRDSDGIADSEDACPDVPGVRDPDPKRNGCPPDRDNDGIADSEDACPDAPGVRDADPKKNGCPPDRDSDGIPDAQDACPNVPGPSNPDPKKNGCPLAYVSEEAKQIKITEQVKFRFNSAQLDPAGDPLLQAVLTILRDHPELQKIEIQGHTDNVGTRAYNMNLSNARARAVLAWLVKHGIETKRLTAKGFGFDVPIADNSTDEGRRENRRVEFHIVDQGKAAESPTSDGAKKLEEINNTATKKAQ